MDANDGETCQTGPNARNRGTDGNQTPTTAGSLSTSPRLSSAASSGADTSRSNCFRTPCLSAQSMLSCVSHDSKVCGDPQASSDPLVSDLNYYHEKAKFDAWLCKGDFTVVRHLANCCAEGGVVELQRWWPSGRSCGAPEEDGKLVVVKRVKASRVFANRSVEANERLARGAVGVSRRLSEDTLNEIGVYCELSGHADMPQYLLKMHAAFHAESDVWMVLEHADGGDMFDAVQQAAGNLSPQLFRPWSWQLLQAVQYLHRHCIAHRDISIENMLIRGGIVRLMDFGQAVRTSTPGRENVPYRFFGLVGKPFYRSPECHLPPGDKVQVLVPGHAKPDEVIFTRSVCGEFLCEVRLPPVAEPGQMCLAENWGYAATSLDIFACGVCIFVMATGQPPWREAIPKDPHFTWVRTHGIVKLLRGWGKQQTVVEELLAQMVSSDPAGRPTAAACLDHKWFAPLRGMPVPVHNELSSVAAETCTFETAHQEMAMAGDFYGREDVQRGITAADVFASPNARIIDEDFGETTRYYDKMCLQELQENPFLADVADCPGAAIEVVCRSADVHSASSIHTNDPFVEFSADKAPPPLPLAILRCVGRTPASSDGAAMPSAIAAREVIPEATQTSVLPGDDASCRRARRPRPSPPSPVAAETAADRPRNGQLSSNGRLRHSLALRGENVTSAALDCERLLDQTSTRNGCDDAGLGAVSEREWRRPASASRGGSLSIVAGGVEASVTRNFSRTEPELRELALLSAARVRRKANFPVALAVTRAATSVPPARNCDAKDGRDAKARLAAERRICVGSAALWMRARA